MAEHNLLNLVITRVDGPVFEGEVMSVTVPGLDGEMTLLANHEPLISTLKAGDITLRMPNGEESFGVTNGTLEVSGNQATILI
jgi:F-type H+-transporting ATPase subunit epsilon